MGRILVIGAGGVSTVAVKKIAMNADIFTDIMVASRTKSKCDRIAADIKNVKVQTAQVDADNVEELVTLFNSFKPDIKRKPVGLSEFLTEFYGFYCVSRMVQEHEKFLMRRLALNQFFKGCLFCIGIYI